MAQKKIAYTERDFLGLRNELLRLTNIYYPDLIKNSNDASIFSVFLDLNAAVTDNLHFSIDRSLQETVLDYAQERSSIFNIARTYGLKIPGNRPSITLVDFSIIVPARGDKEDTRYLGLLRRGAQVRGGGQIFELLNDCDFSTQYNIEGAVNRTKIPNFNSNGVIQNYTITKREVVVNGVTKVFKKEITDIDSKPFFKLFLPERNVLGVTSVIQKEGLGYTNLPSSLEFITARENKWYEMHALAESEIFEIDPSTPADDPGMKVGKYVRTDNKFVTEFTPEGFFFMTFGSGNNNSQKLLDEFSKYGVNVNLNKFMNNVSLGSVPRPNTTLFIQYRVGGGKASNLGAGAINSLGVIDFVVSGPVSLINSNVSNSLQVTNITSALGGDDQMSTEEVRNYVTFNFAAQNRAVTINDYIARIRTMPAQFGAAAKVGVTEIENKVKISLLSYSSDGTLTSNVSSTLKDNVAEYLSNYRMLNDYIEISSAKVIDISIDLDIVITTEANQGQVVSNVIETVKKFFDIDSHEMGETISLSSLYSDVSRQPGVLNVIDVRVFNEAGGTYSNSITTQPLVSGSTVSATYQIATIDQTLFFLPDEMPQIRYPDVDIRVRVKQISRPNFS
jgi:hypothetical protein|tara:strand:+ start:2007 stop:3860 length:1854 start_codon:yes stop_codon:yes gene_type:complete